MTDYVFKEGISGVETIVLDTTDVTAIFINAGWHSGPDAPIDVTFGSTFTTIATSDFNIASRVFVCTSLAGQSSTHTFTRSMTGSGVLNGISFTGGGGAHRQSASAGGQAPASTTSPAGSAIAPDGVSQIAIATIGMDGSPAGVSIDEGFTIGTQLLAVSGVRYGGAIAYKINPLVGVLMQPTWTLTSSVSASNTFTIFARPVPGEGEIKLLEGHVVNPPPSVVKTIEGINLSNIRKFEGFRP